MNLQDVVKTVIIGIITGLISSYITVQRLEVQMTEVEKKLDVFQASHLIVQRLDVRMNEVEKKVDGISRDIYRPIQSGGK